MPYRDPEKKRECDRQANLRWRARNLEKVRARGRERVRRRREENPEKARAANREWYARHADKQREEHRAYHNRRNLGLATRPRPLLCEGCGQPPKAKALEWHHDHASGEFRAWLCRKCNTGFGFLGDTLESAQRVLDNLKRAYRETEQQRWILT